MDLLQELKSRLPENADLEQALTAFNEMGRIPNEEDDDEAYLFEAGFYPMFSQYFTINLTRQYQTAESDDEYFQLTMEICYEPTDDLDEFGRKTVWADTSEELINEVKETPLYEYLAKNNIQITEVNIALNET